MALYNKVNKKWLREHLDQLDETRLTLSFYKYFPISDPLHFRNRWFEKMSAIRVFGRIYVSCEGVNGQVSLPEKQLDVFREILHESPALVGVRLNYAIEDGGKSFYVLKIKVRNKIVADGLDDYVYNPGDGGYHLSAEEFNQLTKKPETIVVDMRNHYESEVGHFQNAICPDVETFREALIKVEDVLQGQNEKDIVMYCTGGIRCEKASAYFKSRGFTKVYQLDGGIIEYTRQVKNENLENKFKGKNFVFDERLGERITDEVIARCHQCGKPSDRHINCANDACHILFIQCGECAGKYHHCCSQKCADFNSLPEEEQREKRKWITFNGTRFGKGRYKAHRHGDLDVL